MSNCSAMVALAVALVAATFGIRGAAGADVALELQTKIPLGNVAGRIDHLALDRTRQLLYVAELGNNSLSVVDLKSGKVARRIGGLSEPQGIAYVAASDLVFVANGGDGSVRWFKGADGAPAGQIDLGDDADNLHVDATTSRVYVGYGNGGLAVLDAASGKKLGDVSLGGHPEGFDFDTTGPSIFVNVPARKAVVVVDRATLKVTATWTIKDAGQNFPMAVDGDARRILSVFRSPSSLAAYSTADGGKVTGVSVCDDADDLFVDPKRHRLYVSCGAGLIDVFDTADRSLPRIARLTTVSGARTELFVPETDQLFLAVRASGTEPAAVWVFKPAP